MFLLLISSSRLPSGASGRLSQSSTSRRSLCTSLQQNVDRETAARAARQSWREPRERRYKSTMTLRAEIDCATRPLQHLIFCFSLWYAFKRSRYSRFDLSFVFFWLKTVLSTVVSAFFHIFDFWWCYCASFLWSFKWAKVTVLTRSLLQACVLWLLLTVS